MRKLALALALVSCSAGAFEQPEVIGIHVGTWHDQPGFCNFNPGLYLRWKSGLTGGVYENSDCRVSAYAGWTWALGPFALTAAAVTGYPGRPVMPALVPSVALPLGGGLSARIAFIPRVEKRGANAVHLMIERKF